MASRSSGVAKTMSREDDIVASIDTAVLML